MKKLISLLTIVFISIFGFINIIEANTVQDNNYSLTVKQQKLALIAALTATGDLPQLKVALAEGLDAGLTINEIKEVLVQMYAYAGFPRSLNGINTFISVVDERKAQGIKDNQGREASPITAEGSKYERGKKVLESLTGRQDPGKTSGFGAFAPEIETFLKEHLFADIFERDVLSYKDRELATIAALSSLKGLEPMLQSHMNMGMNVGLTEAQIKEILSIIGTSVGKQEAEAGLEVLNKVLASRKNK
ncbi:carboxymuconolactone decarboxylase family protein [Entomomonas sp. E2T0]|uniref:carboxymuconolactone decarboxylase family protein n=1 Tax=Entomomonas sp. E2T0 TaxID=2930213 RepID=UPI0022284E03|nr:carboxymuconolactone decarboxylase family protein [Entomomonas sp. E2T0]UYZ83745.1 carboxymuconolactone decarboxylase family protein [Entomomonas sp. E2T0]